MRLFLLKDFVAETIIQIIEGVKIAQERAASLSAEVNPGVYMEQKHRTDVVGVQGARTAQMIEFDVALTTSEKGGVEGGIFVLGGLLGAGAKSKLEASSIAINRVRFSVPVVLPRQEKN